LQKNGTRTNKWVEVKDRKGDPTDGGDKSKQRGLGRGVRGKKKGEKQNIFF